MTKQASLVAVLAVGANSWGRGDDPTEALNNWAKNASIRLSGDMTVHFRLVSADWEIDGLGGLSASRIEKLPSVSFTQKDRMTIWGGQDHLHDKIQWVDDRFLDFEVEHAE